MYKLVIGLASAGFLLIGLSIYRAHGTPRSVLSSRNKQVEISKTLKSELAQAPVAVRRVEVVVPQAEVGAQDELVVQDEVVRKVRVRATSVKVFPQYRSIAQTEVEQIVAPKKSGATEPTISAEEPATETAVAPTLVPQAAVAPLPKKQPIVYPNMWIQAGVGTSYVSVSQTSPALGGLDFDDIKAPSTLARGGFFMTPRLGIDLTYGSSPGKIKRSASIDVQNGDYKRKELSSELLFRNKSFYKKEDSYFGLRAGIRRKQLPFLLPVNLNNLSVLDSTLTSLSLGVDYQYHLHGLRIEWQARYQHPLATGSNQGDLKYKGMAIDATLAAIYPLTENWKVGVYWYTEYQKYKFDYNDASLVQTFSGTSNSLFNNISLRLGAEF